MGTVGDPRSCVTPASLAAVGLRLSNRRHSRRDSTLAVTNGVAPGAGPGRGREAGLSHWILNRFLVDSFMFLLAQWRTSGRDSSEMLRASRQIGQSKQTGRMEAETEVEKNNKPASHNTVSILHRK